MRTRVLGCFVAAILCAFAHFAAYAQMPGGGPGNIAFLRIFDQHKAFSLTADMRSTEKTDTTSASFDLALAEGKVRMEVNVANAKGPMITPTFVAQMKAAGMDRSIVTIRMDRKRLYVIYPGLKAYADVAMPAELVQSMTKGLKLQKTTLGKETIDSHPCTKQMLTLSDDNGGKEQITSWEASDLKGFPVQANFFEGGQNIVLKFRNVKLSPPDPKLFEVPSGYKRYDDVQSLMTQGAAGK
jgi:hypothetical protein